MGLVYQGRAFRTRHGITQKELAAGTGLRAATLVALEKDRTAPSTPTLELIITFFRARGITCAVGDLLVYQEPPTPEEHVHG